MIDDEGGTSGSSLFGGLGPGGPNREAGRDAPQGQPWSPPPDAR